MAKWMGSVLRELVPLLEEIPEKPLSLFVHSLKKDQAVDCLKAGNRVLTRNQIKLIRPLRKYIPVA